MDPVTRRVADHRETVVAALNRLGLLLVAEESPHSGLPGQLIRYVNEHWPDDDGRLLELRRERDAALERGNRLAARLADIAAAGLQSPAAGVLVCARHGCTNALPPPRMGAGAPRRLCLECGPRRRPLKFPELADSWAELIVPANPKGEATSTTGAGDG